MEKKDFYYDLPETHIAQHPSKQRDHSRLLSFDPNTMELRHGLFYELESLLRPGDLLVMNNSKVVPARLFGRREGGEKSIEVLLLRRIEGDDFACLLKPARKAKPGSRLFFGDKEDFSAEVMSVLDDGQRRLRFFYRGIWQERLAELGSMPLPPYIRESLSDPNRYQTVYAEEEGSAAAPTAGLHFTEDLLARLRAAGIETAFVTLHVGLGTFRPVKEERIEDHPMHSEYYVVDEFNAEKINRAKDEGRRVIAVGTTACRVLESVSDESGHVCAASGDTDIFIYPGYRFKVTDALITNFHLPESTLVMLVSALAGRRNILSLYRRAIELDYRFFSFGDAMLLIGARGEADLSRGAFERLEFNERFSEAFSEKREYFDL